VAAVRVLIVDDHTLFAEAIRRTLDDVGLSVIDIVPLGSEAVEVVDRSHPDIILMDISLPDQSGLAAGRAILERHPDAKIVAVTALSERAAIEEALRIGFVGYLSKDISIEQFVNAIRSAMDGHVVMPRRLSSNGRRTTHQEEQVALLASQLTPREREVLALLVEGVSGEVAARRMGISSNTVRTHVQSILTKLQVHSRLEAATFAVRNHLVEIPTPREDMIA
jgi:two-component system nitrate/nitrite response regulator NarL